MDRTKPSNTSLIQNVRSSLAREFATSDRFELDACFRGIVGSMVGGAIGFAIFTYLFDSGFYSLVIPGALVGIGFEIGARNRHLGYGLVSATMGFAACLITEWRTFNSFESFPAFLIKFPEQGQESFLMLGIGVLMAFWFGWGRRKK